MHTVLTIIAVLSSYLTDCKSLSNPDHVTSCEISVLEVKGQPEPMISVCEQGQDHCLVLSLEEYTKYRYSHLYGND